MIALVVVAAMVVIVLDSPADGEARKVAEVAAVGRAPAGEEASGTTMPSMSAEAASLATQAAIAECLAGEARQMVAAWTLDVKSSRGYASPAYEREMGRMIEAGAESARAMEAWADAARQAAVDGSVTAEETTMVEAVERDMADADAALYDAFMSTSAGQLAGALMGDGKFASHVLGLGDMYMQSMVLSGEGTECY